MIFWALLSLLSLVIVFGLPVLSLIFQSLIRRRVARLEDALEEQNAAIEAVERRVRLLTEAIKEAPRVSPPATAPSPVSARAPAVPAPPVSAPPVPAPAVPASVPPPPAVTSAPVSPPASVPPVPAVTPAPPRVVLPPTPPLVTRPVPPPPPPRPPRPTPPIAASEPPEPPARSFDWENLVGVKLFSGIAGIALVLAAVFFLKYSVESGWLSPPVRVAIGVIVAIALLVTCELKAARRYAVTANALDAAAIAILFATFFAAHALWRLIPGTAAFLLLAIVTLLAVLLSIRRDSLFIAVLGLLGGFATPALLSTGENRPIPLFVYLLMLNVGLAWVASRKKWPGVMVLTLALTAVYQWGWVFKFLSASQLPLAMGIFLIFGIAAFAALVMSGDGDRDTPMDVALQRTGLGVSAMPLAFAVYLAAVPAYGGRAALLFGFLLLLACAMLAVSLGRGKGDDHRLHAVGAAATVLVFAIWLTASYASTAWITVTLFTVAFGAFYALAPLLASRIGRPFDGPGAKAVYAAPILLFVFPVIARIEPAAADPLILFGSMFVLLALIAWQSVAREEPGLYFLAAFFAVAAEASWSATFLTPDRLRSAIVLYAAFGAFYLGVPLIGRRLGRELEPSWAPGAVLIASLILLLFLAAGGSSPASLWGLAFLLAILNAGLFIESAAGGLPWLSAAGALLSWVVLAVWWSRAAAAVGLLPSLLVVIGLTFVMLVGHAWAHVQTRRRTGAADATIDGFRHGIYLALVGHLFLFYIAQDATWSTPPWPMLGALTVLTLAVSVSSLAVSAGGLHAAGVTAAALVVLSWASLSAGASAPIALVAIETVLAYALAWLPIAARTPAGEREAAIGAASALFVGEATLIAISLSGGSPGIAIITLAHVANTSLILALAWRYHWPYVAPAAVAPAFFASMAWHRAHPEPAAWRQVMALAGSLYAVFTAYPFVLHRRARDYRDPHLTAIVASVFFFFVARTAFAQGGLTSIVGVVPVGEAVVLALLLRHLLRLEAPGDRDLGRLALVAGAALAFVTVAIPLQLKHQWITIGWMLEGAALAWLYRRIPHRGLLCCGVALMAVAFARLALNPAIFVYEPRGMRVFNWYLYTYLLCAAALLLAGWWLSKTHDRIGSLPRASSVLPAGGVVLLFLLLNIEIADYYATGPAVTFRFGVTLAQDLTYTIGWLIFGLVLLTAGIYVHNRLARMTAVALIAVTTFKAFLYDMGSLGGLYRVASLVGLAISLSLVALALQKFVLQPPKESS